MIINVIIVIICVINKYDNCYYKQIFNQIYSNIVANCVVGMWWGSFSRHLLWADWSTHTAALGHWDSDGFRHEDWARDCVTRGSGDWRVCRRNRHFYPGELLLIARGSYPQSVWIWYALPACIRKGNDYIYMLFFEKYNILIMYIFSKCTDCRCYCLFVS